MATQMYIDESKARAYFLVATTHMSQDVGAARSKMRALLSGSQRRLHMKSESDGKRHDILDTIASISPRVTIFCAPKDGRSEHIRRGHCLSALLREIRAQQPALVCLDKEEGAVDAYRRTIIEQSRGWRTFDYRHMRSADEPMLWIPDAIAWSWQRGGRFKGKVAGLLDVTEIRT